MANEVGERERKIREERASVWNGMTAIMEKFDEDGTLSESERGEYSKREKRLAELDSDLAMVVRHDKMEHEKDEVAENRGVSRDEHEGEADLYERAFKKWLRCMDEEDVDGAITRDEWKALKRTRHVPTDLRAQLDGSSLQTVPGQGGFMIPQGFWANLQIAMKAYGGVLDHTNVIKTATGNEMPWPTNNPTGVVGSYITEANQLGFTDFTFGQGVLYAWTISSGIILASLQLLNDSHFDVDSYVTDRMGEAIGRKVAQELWTGAGSAGKALTGIQVAANANGGAGSGASFTSPGYVGYNSTDTVFTLASPSSAVSALTSKVVSWGSLLKLIQGVDPAYRQAGKCNFFMNDQTVQAERSLTDGFGHPLWEPNTQAGQPDTILGYPVVIDNNMPSLNTTAGTSSNQYTGTASTSTAGAVVFGDLKTAFVVRQVDMAGTMRLTERFADYLQVGYLGYVRMDSQPNDLRAISVYQQGAS